MSRDCEIFKTFDDFVGIFIGQRGSHGVIVHRDSGDWDFHASGSVKWDSYHQAVYRNSRAVMLTTEQLSGLGIPLPNLEQYRGLFSMRWEDNFPLCVAADQVPAGVRSRLAAGPLSVCLVLLEDRYETSHGDGKYLYPNAAFWDKSAAERYVDEINRTESDSAKREWYAYTLREIPLRMDAEYDVVTAGLGAGPYEHFSILDVVRLLEKAPR